MSFSFNKYFFCSIGLYFYSSILNICAKLCNYLAYSIIIYLFLRKKHDNCGKRYNFAATNMKSRQKTYAWLLLAIMLFMQAFNAVHIHEPQIELNSKERCDMCAHHVNHFNHISSGHYHMPCLLCQINSSQQFTLQSTPLWIVQQCVSRIDRPETVLLPTTTPNNRQSRAPPVILI